jgi:hypothetical protein
MDRLSRTYAPISDIAGTAIRLSDMIDEQGRYVVDRLGVCNLPKVWFGSSHGTEKIPVTGCVSISASRVGSTSRGSHGLLVFVAEVESEKLASELATHAADATTTARPRTATSQDHRIIILVGGSTTHGQSPVESGESLALFKVLAATALPDG